MQKKLSSPENTARTERGLFHTDSPAAKIALLGLLTALAIVMGYVEYRIPLPLPVPGIKIGLCNIVIVFVLYRFGVLRALLVSLIRVAVVGLLFGTPISMLYAAGGAVFSLFCMYLLKKTGRFSVIGTSGADVRMSAQKVASLVSGSFSEGATEVPIPQAAQESQPADQLRGPHRLPQFPGAQAAEPLGKFALAGTQQRGVTVVRGRTAQRLDQPLLPRG